MRKILIEPFTTKSGETYFNIWFKAPRDNKKQEGNSNVVVSKEELVELGNLIDYIT